MHFQLRRRPGLRRARAWPFLVPIVVWILVMFGYPIYDTVRMAFSYVNGSNFTTGGWKWAGFQNFRTLPYLQGWNPMLRNTGLFIAGSVIPQFIIGGLLAVTLRENSRPRRWARSWCCCPGSSRPWPRPRRSCGCSSRHKGSSTRSSRASGHSAPYFLQTSNDALIVVILVNIWIGIPFYYLVIQSGLQTIAPDLHEAAVIDGASWWKELTRVTIPLLRETILTVLMLGVAGTMNVFAFVWILTMGGPADATMLPGPLAYTQAFVEFNYGQGAAIILGVVAVLLCVAAMFLLATRSRSGKGRRAKRSAAPASAPRKAYA